LDLQAAAVLASDPSWSSVGDIIKEQSVLLPSDMNTFLALGEPAIAAATSALEFVRDLPRSIPPWYKHGEIKLGPVVPAPPRIFILRGNYIRHRQEMNPRFGTSVERPDRPRYFHKPPTTVIGHGGEIIYPRLSHEVHHEVELAVVIGRSGRWIPESIAYEHVAGYTILLDITARDLSGRDDRNKSFDSFAPIGPCLASTVEVPDPDNVGLTLRINGELRQKGSTADLEYRIPEIISFLSEAITLLPGDIISTGTPEGVGPIHPGDLIEAEAEGIGTLRCSVIAESHL
jgi:2-keto-4-pentenoate hydratase/2-oxohepta-3-ene-1,7-dioic acid hydratase in catechol pathway